MKNLLLKEFRLALHPTNLIFLSFSAMVLIPNYSYYVIFFYTGLGVFFTCLTGRENRDIAYSVSLPVRKVYIVRARFAFVVLVELAQIILAIPFAILRQHINIPENLVGMDANIAFFGLSFLMLGLFNAAFFRVYYRDVNKIGTAFLAATAVVTLFIFFAEGATHVVPFFKNELNTNDPAFLPAKLAVLASGMLAFAALTFIAYLKSARSFEAMDL